MHITAHHIVGFKQALPIYKATNKIVGGWNHILFYSVLIGLTSLSGVLLSDFWAALVFMTMVLITEGITTFQGYYGTEESSCRRVSLTGMYQSYNWVIMIFIVNAYGNMNDGLPWCGTAYLITALILLAKRLIGKHLVKNLSKPGAHFFP